MMETRGNLFAFILLLSYLQYTLAGNKMIHMLYPDMKSHVYCSGVKSIEVDYNDLVYVDAGYNTGVGGFLTRCELRFKGESRFERPRIRFLQRFISNNPHITLQFFDGKYSRTPRVLVSSMNSPAYLDFTSTSRYLTVVLQAPAHAPFGSNVQFKFQVTTSRGFTTSYRGRTRFSSGGIAGIVLGILLVCGICAMGVWCRRRRMATLQGANRTVVTTQTAPPPPPAQSYPAQQPAYPQPIPQAYPTQAYPGAQPYPMTTGAPAGYPQQGYPTGAAPYGPPPSGGSQAAGMDGPPPAYSDISSGFPLADKKP